MTRYYTYYPPSTVHRPPPSCQKIDTAVPNKERRPIAKTGRPLP